MGVFEMRHIKKKVKHEICLKDAGIVIDDDKDSIILTSDWGVVKLSIEKFEELITILQTEELC